MTGAGHIVAMPRWVLGLRVAQVVLAVIILALVSYSTHVLGSLYIGSSYILNIIVCIFTFIAVAYLTLSVIFLPKWYNMWAALGLEIFMTIMWLSAFSNLASASVNMIFISSLDYYYYYKKRDLERRSLPGYTPWDTGAAAAGLGGLEFVLFIITLVLFGIHLHRHRKAGTTSTSLAGPTAPVTQETKYDSAAPAQAQQAPAQPLPVYTQDHTQPQQPQQPQQYSAPMQNTNQVPQQYSNAPEVVNQPIQQQPPAMQTH